jgi:hypothetical protein
MAKVTKVKMDSNPTKINWPTDKWGFTRELRKAVTLTAAKLKGDADKKRLLDDTLEVAIEFLEVNFESSKRERKRMLDKLAAKDAAPTTPKKAVVKKAEPEPDPEPALFDLDEE